MSDLGRFLAFGLRSRTPSIEPLVSSSEGIETTGGRSESAIKLQNFSSPPTSSRPSTRGQLIWTRRSRQPGSPSVKAFFTGNHCYARNSFNTLVCPYF